MSPTLSTSLPAFIQSFQTSLFDIWAFIMYSFAGNLKFPFHEKKKKLIYFKGYSLCCVTNEGNNNTLGPGRYTLWSY